VIFTLRKKSESVLINDDIVLTVVEVRGDKVRLGVTHPKGVAVQRHEVYEALLGHEEVGQGTEPMFPS
jgi:carbon storage regulator